MASPYIEMHVAYIGVVQAVEIRESCKKRARVLGIGMEVKTVDTECSKIDKKEDRQYKVQVAKEQ